MESKKYDVTKTFREIQKNKSDAGVEIDRLTKIFMSEHNIDDYPRAMEHVMIDSPELAQVYTGVEQAKSYMAEEKPAASEVDRLTQRKMLAHNLSYSEAQRLVFGNPEHAELCDRYMSEARRR